ncbi:hypothetical protein EXN32_21875 [Agrobacterium tumefaciens]|uniref:hypothetical protein n=1 Tax=Agrobacterium TaxID=357 RepID=UPI00115CD16D|nr:MULTISPECIES: hypothetical protein [Agrobacterium]MDA5241127.1 hypothetical protein [Agrobacterium sp. MAFF310724]MDA5249582.1 hypothetical protein [Agrobacterium sp. MAFF210268]TRB12355.1 hypothetical protein EXN32_21875 [Agrobacterium tumefaciens]
MVDISNNKWTELDGGNTSASPDGVQGGYQPSTIAPIIRNIRGAVKREYVSTNPVYTSTGSANVYAISFEQPLEITKGKRISFFANVTNTGASTINLNTLGAVSVVRNDGTPLQAGDIIANMPVDLVYDGTRYILQSSSNLSNYSGTIKATAFEGNGSNISNINASNISAGTLNNARLPTTMTGKTFSSETTISDGGLKITAGGLTISAGGAGVGGDLSVTGATNITGNTAVTGSLSQGGSRVVTIADYGSGKGIDSDLLDGQHGAWYRDRVNHTGTQPTNTIAGLDALLAAKVSKSGDTMTGSLTVGSITLNADGSLTAGNSLTTNLTVKNGEMSFQKYDQSSGYQWSMRGGHNTDTTFRWYYNNGNQRMALTDAGRLWTGVHGYLDEAFAGRGAQCPHNSGVWEFGSVDPNYNDRLADAPFPYVLVGLRSSRGTNVINLRAVTLRNQ